MKDKTQCMDFITGLRQKLARQMYNCASSNLDLRLGLMVGLGECAESTEIG